MILPSSHVQLPIVDTYSPTHDYFSWYELILLIHHNRHTSFLRHHLNWTNPRAIRDGIDDTDIKQLQYFSSHHFLYRWIQPLFMLNEWFVGFLHQDLMHANGRAYALDVRNGPPQCRFVLPQHIE